MSIDHVVRKNKSVYFFFVQNIEESVIFLRAFTLFMDIYCFLRLVIIFYRRKLFE